MEKVIKAQVILSAVVTVGFIIITVLIFVMMKEETARQVLTPIVSGIGGAWVVNFTTMINYYFGSTKGSAEKTQMQNEITKSVLDKK